MVRGLGVSLVQAYAAIPKALLVTQNPPCGEPDSNNYANKNEAR